ncbi:MAG: hypothetical protein WKF77_07500 [Planctomycetaceae bacterium]
MHRPAVQQLAKACVLLLVTLCSTTILGQDSSEPIWGPVERAIEKRRELATCWIYEVEGVIVATPQFVDGQFSDGERSKASAPSEGRTYETKKEYQFDFINGRVRLDDYEPSHTERGMVEHHLVWLFDGTIGVLLAPYAKAGLYKGSSKAELQLPSLYGNVGVINPLIWANGIFEPTDILKKRISKVSELGGEWTTEGQYVTWSRSLAPLPVTIKLFFDPTKDYQVVRQRDIYESRPDEPVTSEGSVTDITYDTTEAGGKVISWTFALPGMIDKSFRVVRAERVDSIPIDVFQEPADYMQPGMYVTKDGRPHVMSNARTLVPWVPGSPLPSRRTYWPWFVVPAFLGIGVWYFFRRRS